MKKIFLSLLMTGLVSVAISASAQNAPDDNNTNAPVRAHQAASPPGADTATNAPDPGGPRPMPPDAVTPPEDNQPREPLVITPSQSKAGPPEEFSSAFMPPTQAGTNYND